MNIHLHTCPCGKVTVTFDEKAAKNLPAVVVRKRWPRGNCSECKVIVYASTQHFVQGDW